MDYYAALNAIARPIKASALPHTLEPMIALMRALGNPHRRTPVVVVAGSVGKTTAAHELAWSLRAQGYARIGLYTSPHLHLFRERFRLFRETDTPEMIAQARFAELASEVVAVADRLNSLPGGHRYSTFELATAIAYLWYAREQADIAVMEIGIGGRFDAVNVVNADGGTVRLAVITPVEMEHAAMLGGTLESIAWHKAGIIPQGGVVLSRELKPQPLALLRHHVLTQNALFVQANLISFGIPIEAKPIGRSEVYQIIPGRNFLLSFISLHTAESIATWLETRDRSIWTMNDLPETVILGILQDKDIQKAVQGKSFRNLDFVLTTAPSARGVEASKLAEQFRTVKAHSIAVEPNVNIAFERARAAVLLGTPVTITGSLRMAAAAREYFGLLSPEELDEAGRTRAIFDGEDYQRRAEA